MNEKIKGYLVQVLIESVSVFVIVSGALFILVRFKIVDPTQFGSPPALQSEKITQDQQTKNSSVIPLNKLSLNDKVFSDAVQRLQWVAADSAATKVDTHVIYEGKIDEINAKGGFSKILNLQYALMLKIKGKGIIISQIYFSPNDIKHLTLVQKVGEEDAPITISELKVGDSVNLEMKTDNIKPMYDNILNAKLTKL